MKKTKQILMLPTEEESFITKHLANNDLAPFQGLPYRYVGETFQNQHLYIVSDEQIKEGDWVYITLKPSICQYKDVIGKEWCKKIIATTDKSLEVFIPHMDCNGMGCDECLHNKLPQIPELFIEVYIEYFNSNKPITEVEVEYEEFNKKQVCVGMVGKPAKPIYNYIGEHRLKLQKDNTIEISLVENNSIGTYIAVFVDGEYKNIVIVQAEDIDDADRKLKEQGFEWWDRLEPVEYDSKGICFAINGLR